MSPSHATTLTAAQAAARLGVKPATLYSYVSRGLLRSLPGPGARSRRYLRAEVEALREQAAAGKGHGAVAAGALGWGQPVVETAIGTITPDGPAYRGVLARDLLHQGFEATCALLWQPPPAPGAWSQPAGAPRPGPPPDDAIGALSLMVAQRARVLRWVEQLDGPALATAAARTLRAAAGVLGGAASGEGIAERLARGWGVPAAAADLDAALVWCADHELNASTFAARVAASTGAGLHATLGAGLAALSGPLHGGASRAVQVFLDELATADSASEALASRRARGARPPSLGHRLYPDGDPRAQDLLDRAAARDGPGWEPIDALLTALLDQGHPLPDLDFGLVALCRSWGLADGAPRALFALGRMAGWVAHLQEQRARGQLIRPRARYIGPPVVAQAPPSIRT